MGVEGVVGGGGGGGDQNKQKEKLKRTKGLRCSWQPNRQDIKTTG